MITATLPTLEQGYANSENTINRTVNWFCRTYGMERDREDLLQESFFAFKEAHDAFINGYRKSTYEKLIYGAVKRRLLGIVRKQNVRKKVKYIDPEKLQSTVDQNFDLSRLKTEVSEDAKEVLGLIFDTPQELKSIIVGRGGKPRNYRSGVADWLKKCQWSSRRIKETFTEIKEVLA